MGDLESVKERMRLAAGALRTADLLRDALAVIEAQAQEIARLRNLLGDETEVAHAMVDKAEKEIARLKAQVEHLGAVVKSMGRDYAALQSTTGGDARHD